MTQRDPTPPVNGRYGAPMGRPSKGDGEYKLTADAKPVYLVRCPLNSGGYDAGGAYWGLGEPLYHYSAQPEGLIEGYVRGRTREIAKDRVRGILPGARFYK